MKTDAGWWQVPGALAVAAAGIWVAISLLSSTPSPWWILGGAAYFFIDGIVHEGAHAATALLVGVKVNGVTFERDRIGLNINWASATRRKRLAVALAGPSASAILLIGTWWFASTRSTTSGALVLLVPAFFVALAGVMASLLSEGNDLDLARQQR